MASSHWNDLPPKLADDAAGAAAFTTAAKAAAAPTTVTTQSAEGIGAGSGAAAAQPTRTVAQDEPVSTSTTTPRRLTHPPTHFALAGDDIPRSATRRRGHATQAHRIRVGKSDGPRRAERHAAALGGDQRAAGGVQVPPRARRRGGCCWRGLDGYSHAVGRCEFSLLSLPSLSLEWMLMWGWGTAL